MAHIDTNIGEILTGLIAERGWSQRELARQASVPETTLRSGLHGSRPFRIPDLLAICAVLNVRMSDILMQAEASAA